MASETNQKNPERSLERRKEEAHLKETLEVVRSNVETYGAEVFRMKGDIDEMLEHFHDKLKDEFATPQGAAAAAAANTYYVAATSAEKTLFRQDQFSGLRAEKTGDSVYRKGRHIKGYHPLGGGGLARACGECLL